MEKGDYVVITNCSEAARVTYFDSMDSGLLRTIEYGVIEDVSTSDHLDVLAAFFQEGECVLRWWCNSQGLEKVQQPVSEKNKVIAKIKRMERQYAMRKL